MIHLLAATAESSHFFRQSLPMLPRLIDERRGKRLRRVEVADRKPVELARAVKSAPMCNDSIVLTREVLYNQVWSEPILHVTKKGV